MGFTTKGSILEVFEETVRPIIGLDHAAGFTAQFVHWFNVPQFSRLVSRDHLVPIPNSTMFRNFADSGWCDGCARIRTSGLLTGADAALVGGVVPRGLLLPLSRCVPFQLFCQAELHTRRGVKRMLLGTHFPVAGLIDFDDGIEEWFERR